MSNKEFIGWCVLALIGTTVIYWGMVAALWFCGVM